jgi:cystathionine gamma-synthase
MPSPREPQTVAAANGIAADEAFGAVTPPIYLSSTFAFAGFERSDSGGTMIPPGVTT